MPPVGVASGAASVYLRGLSLSSPTLASSKPSLATCVHKELNTSEEKYAALRRCLPRTSRCCPCGRRHLIGDCAAAWASLLPLVYVKAGNSLALDANGSMEKFRPARPDWYEELFAKAMEEGMRSYEAEQNKIGKILRIEGCRGMNASVLFEMRLKKEAEQKNAY